MFSREQRECRPPLCAMFIVCFQSHPALGARSRLCSHSFLSDTVFDLCRAQSDGGELADGVTGAITDAMTDAVVEDPCSTLGAWYIDLGWIVVGVRRLFSGH